MLSTCLILSISRFNSSVPEISKVAARLVEAGIPLQGKLYTVEGVKQAILEYMKGGAV